MAKAISAKNDSSSHFSPVMYQSWRNLAFLHWKMSASEVQRTLPAGLTVDLCGGSAYVGIVPFEMCDVRPSWGPAVRGISNFLEINLRTYVIDECGEKGVWFYTLQANQRLAVWLGKRLFCLPYAYSQIEGSQTERGFRYELKSPDGDPSRSLFSVEPNGIARPAAVGTLEHFLVERYSLMTRGGRRPDLLKGRVGHAPYEICSADLKVWNDRLFDLAKLDRPGRPPDHVLFSPGVEVEVFGLERISVESTENWGFPRSPRKSA